MGLGGGSLALARHGVPLPLDHDLRQLTSGPCGHAVWISDKQGVAKLSSQRNKAHCVCQEDRAGTGARAMPGTGAADNAFRLHVRDTPWVCKFRSQTLLHLIPRPPWELEERGPSWFKRSRAGTRPHDSCSPGPGCSLSQMDARRNLPSAHRFRAWITGQPVSQAQQ